MLFICIKFIGVRTLCESFNPKSFAQDTSRRIDLSMITI
jgi:hypothetical protein